MTMPAAHGRIRKVLTAVRRCQSSRLASRSAMPSSKSRTSNSARWVTSTSRRGHCGERRRQIRRGLPVKPERGWRRWSWRRWSWRRGAGGKENVDVVSQMKERIYALSRELPRRAAARRPQAALITAGWHPQRLGTPRRTTRASWHQAPADGRFSAAAVAAAAPIPHPGSRGSGRRRRAHQPHPPSTGRPVGMGTGAAAVADGRRRWRAQVGKRGAAGGSRKERRRRRRRAAAALTTTRPGVVGTTACQRDGPAARAQAISSCAGGGASRAREAGGCQARGEAARAAQLNLATQSRAAQLSRGIKAAAAARAQQVVQRKAGMRQLRRGGDVAAERSRDLAARRCRRGEQASAG